MDASRDALYEMDPIAPEALDADSRDASFTDRGADPGDSEVGDAADGEGPEAPAVPRDCARVGNVVSWTRGKVRVDYDLGAGTASF